MPKLTLLDFDKDDETWYLAPPQSDTTSPEAERQASQVLNGVLARLGLPAKSVGCSITQPLHKYSIDLNGCKLSRLESTSVQKEIALALKASAPPVVYPKYEEGVLMMELMFGPHPIVYFDRVKQSVLTQKPGQLDMVMGTTNVNTPLVRDLSKMPHLLVAGTTGSGKSSLIHCLIKSLLRGVITKPNVQLCLLDAKMVEFNRYNGIKELICEVGNAPDRCLEILKAIQAELYKRLERLSKKKCQNIVEYNAKGYNLPYLVVVIDELADLVRHGNFSEILGRIAAMGRAAGIHLIVSVYHPTHTVIEGALKANFSCRVAMRVASPVHSRVVLDTSGAENLMGNGDGLFLDGAQLTRFRGAFLDMEKENVRRKTWFQNKFGF